MTKQNDKLSTEPVNNSFWFEEVVANTAQAYAAGEVIGVTSALVARGHSGGGIIRVVNAIDRDAQSISLRIWFFRRRPTVFADGATFAIGDNDEAKLAGYVDLDTYVTVGGKAIAQNRSANLDFSCPDDHDGIGKLWYTVEAQGSGTYTAANRLRINMGDWPD